MFDEFQKSLINTYAEKKSNILMKNTYNPSLHGFFNTNLDYKNKNSGNLQKNKKKFKTKKEILDEGKDEKTKKLEILLNAKNKAQKTFDQKIRNHLREEKLYANNNSQKVKIKFLLILLKLKNRLLMKIILKKNLRNIKMIL